MKQPLEGKTKLHWQIVETQNKKVEKNLCCERQGLGIERLRQWCLGGGGGFRPGWDSDSGLKPSEKVLGEGVAQAPPSQGDLCSASTFGVQRIRPNPPGGSPGLWVGEHQMDSPLLHIQRDLFLLHFPALLHLQDLCGQRVSSEVSRGQRGAAKGLAWRTEGAPRRRREPEGRGVPYGKEPGPEVRQGPWKVRGHMEDGDPGGRRKLESGGGLPDGGGLGLEG